MSQEVKVSVFCRLGLGLGTLYGPVGEGNGVESSPIDDVKTETYPTSTKECDFRSCLMGLYPEILGERWTVGVS